MNPQSRYAVHITEQTDSDIKTSNDDDDDCRVVLECKKVGK